MALQVSVITASHRPDLIGDLLNAFAARQMGSVVYEIIVVADYPIDEYRKRYPGATWLFLDDRSISAKRNMGIAASSAPVIAFIDDDCKPLEHWLQQGYEYLMNHPDIAGLEGLTTIESSSELSGARREYMRLETQGYRTNNIFYRRSVLDQIGRFDERFTVQREDLDLAFSILKKGYEIHYNDSMRVEHRFRHWEKWDLLKNCRNRRFDPLLFKKHPRHYRSHVGSPFPGTLSVLMLMHVAAFSFLIIRSRFTIAVFGVDLVFALAITIRRSALKNIPVATLVREWVSVIIAPTVLLSALVQGSVKFRKFLIM